MKHFAIDQQSRSKATAIEVRLFNSMQRYAEAGQWRKTVFLASGDRLNDLIRRLGIPFHDLHLVMKNGRPVEWSCESGAADIVMVGDGDVVALSGPVPFNWRI